MTLWPWQSIGYQILLRTKYVPSLVKIHWRMLILRVFTRIVTDGSITISPRNFVGEGIISNLYRGPSIDASYQVSVHLAKRFQRRRFFLNRPIRNKNCLWWLCLLMDPDKMSNLYRGPSIDASYQVSVHLAKRFQRRRFFKIGQSETRIACGGHVC